ncbi:Glutamate or tyrosine decarboxylase [Bryocella elongata]|uniref:Glutamate or tyrosine decarboxylase n=2 Tax=Bryocella elongata TaxID=863522 RepID=A0A1H5Z8D0_9BACT|nr:Glutamate or tyrosine decarboxylase [Bryocella elongata]
MALMPDQKDSLRAALSAALDHALTFRAADADAPVAAQASHEGLFAKFNLPLADEGLPSEQVIRELIHAAEGGISRNTGGRFYGWVMGGSTPASLAADWLTSAWDQNAGAYAVAPAAAVAEEVAGEWLKDILHLPAEASFALVTGCQMAHTTCLAAARWRLMADRNIDVERNGLAGAPQIRIITSKEAHGTALRAVRLLGLGTANIHSLPSDENGRLTAEVLTAALADKPDAPTIVLLQAGDLNMGAYDDFATLIPIAKAHKAWVHVDGAFGLWAAATPRLAHLVAGCNLADSWATDGHKWLNVPYDSGFAFVRDREAHRGAFAISTSYVEASVGRDQLDWTPEWSRRARGFSAWAVLRELGRNGVAALIERTCAHSHALVTRIGALDGAEMLWKPQINQGLVRFLSPKSAAVGADHDAFTDQVVAAINRSGVALFSNANWRGKRVMRVSVCNWQTSEADVDRVVAGVSEILATLRSE